MGGPSRASRFARAFNRDCPLHRQGCERPGKPAAERAEAHPGCAGSLRRERRRRRARPSRISPSRRSPAAPEAAPPAILMLAFTDDFGTPSTLAIRVKATHTSARDLTIGTANVAPTDEALTLPPPRTATSSGTAREILMSWWPACTIAPSLDRHGSSLELARFDSNNQLPDGAWSATAPAGRPAPCGRHRVLRHVPLSDQHRSCHGHGRGRSAAWRQVCRAPEHGSVRNTLNTESYHPGGLGVVSGASNFNTRARRQHQIRQFSRSALSGGGVAVARLQCLNLGTDVGPPDVSLEDSFYRMEKLHDGRPSGDEGEHVRVGDTFAQGGLDLVRGRCPAVLINPRITS